MNTPGRTLPYHRWCFAAAHIAVNDSYANVPHSVGAPGSPEELAEHIDWDTTLTFRCRLDGLGFGVAEAMDTAQRFAIGWHNARMLIEETGKLALDNGFIAGAGSDAKSEIHSDDDLITSVIEEAEIIQNAGGLVILLPLPHLALTDAAADRYVDVYTRIIDRLDGPLFLHWLGEAFMPALKGYFPEDSFREIMAHNTTKVRGAKLSLLDDAFEIETRQAIAIDEQIILTGDDFNFSGLILGDGNTPTRHTNIGDHRVPIGDFSHALLGVFDGIALPAARALNQLTAGNVGRYREIMEPCEELGRWIFQEPTQYYKSGLAFLAWLNGHQNNAMLLNHEDRSRDRDYYEGLFERARTADALIDPELAMERFRESVY